MFKIKLNPILFATMVTATLSSCGNNFLELDPYQQVNDYEAIQNADDVNTAINGVYYRMGSVSFCGRNLIALGDVASDNSDHFYRTTHFTSIFEYSFNENDSYLDGLWTTAYRVIDHSSHVIVNGEKLLKEAASASEKAQLKKGLGQAYALRAYATFTVANVFGLPYQEQYLNTPGAVLVYEPVKALEKVERSDLKTTYAYIQEQLEKADDYLENTSFGKDEKFYMNARAVKALAARVSLYKGDYAASLESAREALEMKSADENKLADNELSYGFLFDDLKGSNEDIFVIAKSSDDNLSANSLNTLYTNYGVDMSADLHALYADTDIRKSKMTAYVTDSKGNVSYYAGGKYMETITNIPVFRLPELYLIIAECEARLGNTAASAEALLPVAARNQAIVSVEDLPQDNAALLSFIAQERRRELFQEGHRLFDARRTGESILVQAGSYRLDNGLFLFPIPSSEINAGFGVKQNENWTAYMPVKL